MRALQAQHPVPVLPANMINPASMAGDTATKLASPILSKFNASLTADNAAELASCFFDEQAWWKDQLALTYHLRTFTRPSVIAAALLDTSKLRQVPGVIKLEGEAHLIPACEKLS